MQDNIGRESSKDNDLFFTCSLIDYISRKTKNIRADVVNQLFMIWQMCTIVTI